MLYNIKFRTPAETGSVRRLIVTHGGGNDQLGDCIFRNRVHITNQLYSRIQLRVAERRRITKNQRLFWKARVNFGSTDGTEASFDAVAPDGMSDGEFLAIVADASRHTRRCECQDLPDVEISSEVEGNVVLFPA